MGPQATEAYRHFHALDLPLRNLVRRNRAKSIQAALVDALPACQTKAQHGSEKGWDGQIHIETFQLGALTCICAKTTPMVAVKEVSDLKTVVLQYAGQTHYREEGDKASAPQGSILIHSNRDGLISVDGGCAITFEIEPVRLSRACRAMGGRFAARIDDRALQTISGEQPGDTRRWFSLFQFVDALLAENQCFPTAMALDEQIYRLMALHHLQAVPGWRDSYWQDKHVNPGEAVLSRLEAWIVLHCRQPISLTDLELQSSYSARQLQNIFMQKHGCSPMRFVRRARLQAALQRLEAATSSDSVASISRDMGYRQASHFAADFRREFGHSPSDVLRAARRSQVR